MMDNRREHFRLGLNNLYTPVYDAICHELGQHWQPYYGLRTIAEQAALYAHSKDLPKSQKATNAPAGFSPHNYGCASDWTLWDDKDQPIWDTKDPRWVEYTDAIKRVGARWGGDWGDVDHNELKLRIGWKNIGTIYLNEGYKSAIDAVQEFKL